MIHTLEMTVLIDNVAAEPLVSEWGLSILITADDRSILLDTGASHLFAQNAERLGVDLNSVDTGVLSHAHYDHADGMDTFFSLNRKAPFLVREGICEERAGNLSVLIRLQVCLLITTLTNPNYSYSRHYQPEELIHEREL